MPPRFLFDTAHVQIEDGTPVDRASASNTPLGPLPLITRARVATAIFCAVVLAVGALVLKWSLLELMALFWFETALFGLIALLKMAVASVATRRVREGVLLFLLCSSLLCFFSYFHLVMVLRIFCGTANVLDGLERCASPLATVSGFQVALSIIVTAALLDFAGWCITLKLHTDVLAAFGGTFGRAAIATIALFLGGTIFLVFGIPQIAFLILILLKMFMDIGIALVGSPTAQAP